MAGLDLLIADDEPLGAMALRSQLEALGHRVAAHARNGRHAIDLARCFLVDAAILDFRMPGLTGLEAAARIFRDRPLPILLLSGFREPGPMDRPPAYHYLVKPLDTQELRAGLDAARDAFQQWHDSQPDQERIRRLNDRARSIDRARALLARRNRSSQLAACQTLLQRAESDPRPLHEIATEILQQAGDSHGQDLTC